MSEPVTSEETVNARSTYEELKSEYGNATRSNPLVLGDPERLGLSIHYAALDYKDSKITAKRLAFNYLNIGDFESAQEILEELGYTPGELLKDLDNLYAFTGLEKYRDMGGFYLSSVFKELTEKAEKIADAGKERLWIRWITDMRTLQREETVLERKLKNTVDKRDEYLKLEKKIDHTKNLEEWNQLVDKHNSLHKKFYKDAYIDEDIKRLQLELGQIRTKIKRTTAVYRESKERVDQLFDEKLQNYAERLGYDELPKEEKPKKGLLKKWFSKHKK